MSWTRIPDEFPDASWDRSDAALRLHLAGLIYSNRLLTDGRIPKSRIAALVPRYRPAALRELVDAGWWADRGDSIEILHDLQHQATAAEVRKRRADTAARVARWRAEHA
ncbi:MAG: hypothetical protein AB1627_15400 [Chloroflexota bacterium]